MALETVAITSRRYLGNKASIAPWIVDTVRRHLGHRPQSVADLFAGTGSVAWAFNHADTRVLANDILHSNYVCLQAWLTARADPVRLRRCIDDLNGLPANDDNYVSDNFGNRYWPLATARHIGAVRERIEQLPLAPDEKHILIASLLYAADRLANTCGHYDAFRKAIEPERRLELRWPESSATTNVGNEVHCADANNLVAGLDTEVLYLDPPYNSRQYSDTYHVLENLACWSRPPLYGVARKMDRRHLKSRYCTNDAAEAFADLVSRARCRLLVVSYNNMGQKGDPRSQARIDDALLLQVLRKRGPVEVEERDFRAFNAGKKRVEDHRERLFVCHVR